MSHNHLSNCQIQRWILLGLVKLLHSHCLLDGCQKSNRWSVVLAIIFKYRLCLFCCSLFLSHLILQNLLLLKPFWGKGSKAALPPPPPPPPSYCPTSSLFKPFSVLARGSWILDPKSGPIVGVWGFPFWFFSNVLSSGDFLLLLNQIRVLLSVGLMESRKEKELIL